MGAGEPQAGASFLSSSAAGKAGFVPQVRDLSTSTSSPVGHFDKSRDFLPTQGFFKGALRKGGAFATFP